MNINTLIMSARRFRFHWRIVRRWILAGALLGATAFHAVSADDWFQWRGPGRENISHETGLLEEWPEEGLPLLWEITGLGDGIASVSVVAGQLYTVGYHDGGEFLWRLDALSGQKIWAYRLGPPVRDHPLMRWLTQRTPVVDKDRVFSLTAQGVLWCLTVRDGSPLWSRNYQADFNAKRHAFGYNDHPLLDEDSLICCPAGEEISVVSLDKHTGEIKWSTRVPNSGANAYGATVRTVTGGVPQYIVKFHGCIAGVAADDGRLLWRYGENSGRTASSHTPIVYKDRVLNLNPYGRGAALLQLIPRKGDAGFEIQELYNRNIYPASPFQDVTIRIGTHLYAAANASRLVCLEMEAGQITWGPIDTDASGLMGMTYADGHLYILRADGTMTLVKATPKEYRPISRFQIPDMAGARGVTMPVVSHHRLFIRDNDRLLCFGITPDALSEPRLVAPLRQLTLSAEEKQLPRSGAHRERLTPQEKSDAIFVPTPPDIAKAMLEVAKVKSGDIVYDLGSGEGDILIAAARDFDAKGVGIEIEPDLVKQSRQHLIEMGLQDRVTILQGDFFKTDFQEADVVTVFLPPDVLDHLLPQFKKMKPGSRIVSHQFAIPHVKPVGSWEIYSEVDQSRHTIHLWRMPLLPNE